MGGAVFSFLLVLCISFYHGDIQRNALDYFVIEIISVIFFIHTPKVYFDWARGANARGEPKEEGGNSQARIPPSPLGFPLALPFPHSLPPRA